MANARASDNRWLVANEARDVIAKRFSEFVSKWAANFGIVLSPKAALEGDYRPEFGGRTYLLLLMADRTEYSNPSGGLEQVPVSTRILNFVVDLGDGSDLLLQQRQALILQDVLVRTATLLDQYALVKGLQQKAQPGQPIQTKPEGKPATISAPAFTIAGFRFEMSGKPSHVWMYRADGPAAGEGAEVHTDMLRKALADFFTKKF